MNQPDNEIYTTRPSSDVLAHNYYKNLRLPLRNRLLELLCVLFGHNWTSYGLLSSGGRIIKVEMTCGTCGLTYIEYEREVTR